MFETSRLEEIQIQVATAAANSEWDDSSEIKDSCAKSPPTSEEDEKISTAEDEKTNNGITVVDFSRKRHRQRRTGRSCTGGAQLQHARSCPSPPASTNRFAYPKRWSPSAYECGDLISHCSDRQEHKRPCKQHTTPRLFPV